jgi:hypothetical protein
MYGFFSGRAHSTDRHSLLLYCLLCFSNVVESGVILDVLTQYKVKILWCLERADERHQKRSFGSSFMYVTFYTALLFLSHRAGDTYSLHGI